MPLKIIKIFFALLSLNVSSDSLKYNSLNMHGVIGLINTPSARFFDKNDIGFTYSDSDSYQLSSISFMPFDFIEISTSRINTSNQEIANKFDKEINSTSIKLRIKEEGTWPALAIGLNNFDGPSFNASEYFVANYGRGNIDFSLGIGWGALNKHDHTRNKLIDIDDNLAIRESYDKYFVDSVSRDYFSGSHISFFGGINYVVEELFLLKIEYDSYKNPFNEVPDDQSDINYGIEYIGLNNFNIGFFSTSNDEIIFKMTYVLDL